MKTYVTDTAALMDAPNLYEQLSNCIVVVPVTVIRQLDGLKNSDNQDRSNAARTASRIIDNLGSKGDISTGVTIGNNVTVLTTTKFDKLNDGTGNESDDKIIGTAVKIKREGESDVTVLTTDRNMRTVARTYGVTAEPFGGSTASNTAQETVIPYAIETRNYKVEQKAEVGLVRSFINKFHDFKYAEMALAACLPALFAIGWLLATSAKHNAEAASIYYSVAFILFAASYAIAYSWRSTIRTKITYGMITPENLWLYRGLAALQAFTAGLILSTYRLATVSPIMRGPHAGFGADHLFSLLFVFMAIVTISTWLFTCLNPRSVITIMPIAIFIVGTVMSSLMARSPIRASDSSAMSVFYLFDGGQSASFFTIVLYLSGIALKYSAYIALGLGTLYAIIRPYWSRSYQGYENSSAMNGYIAAVIVMVPCFPPNAFFNAPSVMNGIRWEPLSFYSIIVWSWIIGNFIVHVPYIWGKLKPSNALAIFSRSDVPQKGYIKARQGQSVVDGKPVNKVTTPTQNEKDWWIASLVGQSEALTKLWDSTISPVLSNQRQFGNAILLGPTGVGKTQTAKEIARLLYGDRLLRFDMNQYGTEHEATRLFGSAPGYIGSEQGGELPNGIRDMAPCVILLDEIEKAHPIILQALLQLCGEGYAKDSSGRRYDATSSIIIMTSNIWPERANELWQMPQDKIKTALRGYTSTRFAQNGPVQLFSPEFLGRVNAVMGYKPFTKEIAREAVEKMLFMNMHWAWNIVPGSDKAIADAIDVSEGYRGVKNSFDDWIGGFESGFKKNPEHVSYSLAVAKKAGGLQITLKTKDGELIKQETKWLQKGYLIDVTKLNDYQNSPLKSVLGQDVQIAEIVEHLKIAASGFVPSPNRPMGVFLLAGPTGVGKTETARALADWLFDGRLIKKDMGEYKSALDGARLFGDRHKMGDLTREVQEAGSCVVLLDEIEKANKDGVLDTLLSLFDDGLMTDAAVNMKVPFKNTVIIMTTNLEPDSDEPSDVLATLSSDKRRDLFAYHFKKEFLGRVDKVLLYNDLPAEAVVSIITKRVQQIVRRKKEEEGITITIADNVYAQILKKVQASDYGVRGTNEIIASTLGLAVSEISGAEQIDISLQNDLIVARKMA